MPPLKYKKKFKVILGLAALVVLIFAGSITAYLVRYSATGNRVCGQCHPELVELWKQSRGHPAEKTACFHCHSKGFEITPGGWNIIRYARDQLAPPEYLADDELTSQRCLDCHKDVLDFNYKVKKKVIKFNHRFHHGEGLGCLDCHRTAGHEYLTGGTNRPSTSECLNCHLREFEGPPKSQKCLNCHDVILAPGKSWEDKTE